METIEVFTDGGSRGNPGPSASSYLVKKDGRIITSGSKYLGESTNNRAEYTAVGLALRALINDVEDVEKNKIIFYIDSQLVVRQLNGVYKIKDPVLKKLAMKIKLIEKKIPAEIKYLFVNREKNKEADFLVNETLDENS